MAGQIKVLIDKLINEKAKGNAAIANSTKTKLILKGINVAKYTATSPDEPDVIQKVKQAAAEMGVRL